MIKIILPDSYNFQDPIASLVNVHSKGVDKDWIEKRAAAPEFVKTFSEIRPEKDHSLLHLIAMGASDVYSTNRNGDGFFKFARELDLIDPNWRSQKLANGDSHVKSADTFANRTDTGLFDRYSTFEKFANVYKHHKNKPSKGDKIYGSVKAAAYNNDMDRVELLVQVPDDEWREELHKLASGEGVPFSMACIVNPSTPILTSRGYVAISDINVGDMVATHKNRWRKVTKLMRRKYTGPVCKVTMSDFPFTLVLTADHPMLASLSRQHAMLVSSNPGGEELLKNKPIDNTGGDWLHVHHLKSGDWVMCVPPPEFDCKPVSSSSLAYMLGEILCDPTKNLSNFKDPAGKRGIYGGMYTAGYDAKIAYIAALVDSNKCTIGPKIIWNEDDYYVMLQVRDLLHSCGIWNRVIADTITRDGKTVPTFKVNIPWEFCRPLLKYSTRLSEPEHVATIMEASDGLNESYDLYLNYQIKKVDIVNLVETQVYNIEVEEDHSYIMAGFVSHNCKVPYDICSYCGHKGKNRGEYCEHLAKSLGTLDKTGHIITAVNDYPTFFDISRVNRPADRIAWGLVKSASALLGAADLAIEMGYDEYPDLSVIAASNPKAIGDRIELLGKLAEIEKEIPVHVHKIKSGISKVGIDDRKLMTLAGKHEKLGSLLKALNDEQILLPISTFAKLVFGNNEKIASIAKQSSKQLASLFTNCFVNLLESTASNLSYNSANTTDGYCEKIASDLSSELSLDRKCLERRFIRNILTNDAANTRENDNIKLASGTNELQQVQQLLAQYASYELSFLLDQEKMSNYDGLVCSVIAQNLSQV